MMKNQLATYFSSIILAMVITLSSGFDACAESYDIGTEIESTEIISPTSSQENVAQTDLTENKLKISQFSVLRKLKNISIIDFDIISTDRQKVFCNFRE